MIFIKVRIHTPNVLADKKNKSEHTYSSVNVDRQEEGMFKQEL